MSGGWLSEGRRAYVGMGAGVAVGLVGVLVLRANGEAPGDNVAGRWSRSWSWERGPRWCSPTALPT